MYKKERSMGFSTLGCLLWTSVYLEFCLFVLLVIDTKQSVSYLKSRSGPEGGQAANIFGGYILALVTAMLVQTWIFYIWTFAFMIYNYRNVKLNGMENTKGTRYTPNQTNDGYAQPQYPQYQYPQYPPNYGPGPGPGYTQPPQAPVQEYHPPSTQ